LKSRKKGFYLPMNANSKLDRIRELAKSKVLELQPFAGEEMNLDQTDPHRAGFIDGERAMAMQILALIDGKKEEEQAEPIEQEMILSLGQT
jgi:hypothetical protein